MPSNLMDLALIDGFLHLDALSIGACAPLLPCRMTRRVKSGWLVLPSWVVGCTAPRAYQGSSKLSLSDLRRGTYRKLENPSRIRVSSSSAWIPYGRLYNGFRLALYLHVVVAGPTNTIVLIVLGCAEIPSEREHKEHPQEIPDSSA